MRILSINIKSGGLTGKIDALLSRALAHRADIYVLSEYRDTPMGARIRSRLDDAGFTDQAYSQHHRGNGVLVAGRQAFHSFHNIAGLPEDAYPNAMIECVFDGLHVVGVYLPGQDRKVPHLNYLIGYARALEAHGAYAIVIGDFNSGRNATDIEANAGGTRSVDEFSTAPLYAQLEGVWHEAWAHLHPGTLEYSWYPELGTPRRKNGWRLDKAFVSTALLPHVRAAFYDHAFRLEGLTDHSALIIDLSFPLKS